MSQCLLRVPLLSLCSSAQKVCITVTEAIEITATVTVAIEGTVIVTVTIDGTPLIRAFIRAGFHLDHYTVHSPPFI